MEPTTVLIVNWAGVYGGAEKYQINMVRGFDQSRYRFLFASPPGDLVQRLHAAGYEHREVPLRPGLDLDSVLRLRRIIQHDQVDIVHALQSRSLLQGGLAAKLAGGVAVVQTEYNIAMSWYVRGEYPWYVRWINNPLRGVVVRYLADHVLTLGKSGRDYYVQVLHIPESRVTAIPGPHSVYPEHPDPANAEPVIGTPAELTERKGIHILIKAAPQILAKHPGAQFQIAGRGHLEQQLRQQIADEGVQDNVHLLGFVPDVTERMPQWDLMVLPSLSDLYPQVILEAMAHGLPVVSTQLDGAREMVVNGETGILVPPGDAPALAEAITKLLDDRGLAQSMGRKGRQRIAQEHSIEGVVRQIEAVYDAVLAERRRRHDSA